MNAYFGVPQISMQLSSLPEVQRQAVRTVLASWMETRETVLFGRLHAGLPSENYPVIEARHGGNLVIGVYQPLIVEIDLTGLDEFAVLNATAGDRLVMRWSGRRVRLSGETRTSTGEQAGRFAVNATPGLYELAVPVSGIVRFRVEAGAAGTALGDSGI
jgi:alpha-galactosidase